MDRKRRSDADSTTAQSAGSDADPTDQIEASTDPDEPQQTASTMAAKPAPAQPDLPKALRSGMRVGRYVVLGPLGRGGMGVVVKAFDPELDRAVALKLIRPDTRSDPRAIRRLSREAQALARLSHPNVVPVFDVGEDHGTIFVAMELVEGTSVRRWMTAHRRSRREILEVFTDAGRGLAAAHRKGMVHRDFNPSNVLVGDDGRVRVLDFGLARSSSRDSEVSSGEETLEASSDRDSESDETDPAHSSSGDRLLDAPLTRVGTVVGTPGYMAPEQARGEEVDARSDQFSFCVSLYRALCGKRPFPPKTPSASSPLEPGRKPLPPPRESDVPSWLARVMARGLSHDPAERFPSMDALLAELARGQQRPRKLALVGLAVMTVAGGTGILVASAHRGDEPERCTTGAQEVARVWNDAERARVEGWFDASKGSGAKAAGERAVGLLGRYAESWAAARDESCAATRIHGTQSEELLDRSMYCLDRRLHELSSTVGVLQKLASDAPNRAVEVAAAITPAERCLDRDALHLGVEVAESPTLRAGVEEIWPLMDEARLLSRAGRPEESLALAREALARAEKLDFPPIRAEALFRVGFAQIEAEGYGPAIDTLEKAFATAVNAGDEDVAGWAAIQIVYLRAFRGGDPELVDHWLRLAEAYRNRVQDHKGYAARLAQDRAMIASNRGDDDAALHYTEEALRIVREDPNAPPTDLCDQLSHLSVEYNNRGDFTRALELNSEALELAEKVLGPDHEEVGKYLINQARPLYGLGRYEESLVAAHRSRLILEASLDPENPILALPLLAEAEALDALGRSDEGLKLALRVIALREHEPGPDGSWLADALVTGAQLAGRAGNWSLANELAARAVETAKAAGENRSGWTVSTIVNAAISLRVPDDCPRIIEWLELAHAEIAGDPQWSGELATTWAQSGRCRLAQGHLREAVALEKRAAERREQAGFVDSTILPELQFALAEVLYRQRRKQSVAYALGALEYTRRIDHPAAKELSAEVGNWLDRHGVEVPPPSPRDAVKPAP